PVLIASRKGRALICYLTLRQGVEFARLSLTGMLWGERSEGQARASLRQTLSELRSVLAGSAGQSIVATRETVTWKPGSAWIDAKALEALADTEDKDALEEAAKL